MVKLNTSKFLKSDEVQTGDSITFCDVGEWLENTKYKYPDGNVRKDFVITVEHKSEKKSFRLNKTNRTALIASWGNETEKWVGKSARISLENVLVSGERKKMILLSVPGVKEPGPEKAWDE